MNSKILSFILLSLFINSIAQEDNFLLLNSINTEVTFDIASIDETESFIFLYEERKLPYNNSNLIDLFYNSQ